MTHDSVIFGAGAAPEESKASWPDKLPGGWTESDLDLSPWVITMVWEVRLRADKPLSPDPSGVDGRKPCAVTVGTEQGSFKDCLCLTYPPVKTVRGTCTITNLWPFPIRNAPARLVERAAQQLEKMLREADLLDTTKGD